MDAACDSNKRSIGGSTAVDSDARGDVRENGEESSAARVDRDAGAVIDTGGVR